MRVPSGTPPPGASAEALPSQLPISAADDIVESPSTHSSFLMFSCFLPNPVEHTLISKSERTGGSLRSPYTLGFGAAVQTDAKIRRLSRASRFGWIRPTPAPRDHSFVSFDEFIILLRLSFRHASLLGKFSFVVLLEILRSQVSFKERFTVMALHCRTEFKP